MLLLLLLLLAPFNGECCLAVNEKGHFMGISGIVISVFSSTTYLKRSIKRVGNFINGQKTAYISGLMRCPRVFLTLHGNSRKRVFFFGVLSVDFL